MSRVIEDGRGSGFVAGVDTSRNLLTSSIIRDPADEDEVAGVGDGRLRVEILRAPLERSGNDGGSVSTTSDELVPAATGRQSITFWNTGSNAVRLNFGETAAGDDDPRLEPGERLTLDIVGDEAVQAKAVADTSTVKVWEWIKPL